MTWLALIVAKNSVPPERSHRELNQTSEALCSHHHPLHSALHYQLEIPYEKQVPAHTVKQMN